MALTTSDKLEQKCYISNSDKCHLTIFPRPPSPFPFFFLHPSFFSTIPHLIILSLILGKAALVSALSFLGWRRVTREEHEKTIRVSWNKNTYTLDFKDFTNGLHEASVKDLKLKFKDLTNVPIATMNMKVSGAHIKDDTATLESVGVHPYCVVELSGELLDQDQVAQQTSSGNPEEYALIQRIASIVDDLSSNFIETIDSYENSLKEQQAKLEINKDHKLDDDGRKKLQDHGIYCSERLMQALIRLDAVECPMEFDKARQKRRESVRFTQHLLDRVDILRSTARSVV